jgi:hypothetical protein
MLWRFFSEAMKHELLSAYSSEENLRIDFMSIVNRYDLRSDRGRR